MSNVQPAILLLGPTGSGKTPLGQALEQRGLHGRGCRHFDFGEHLRAVAEGRERVAALSGADLEFIGRVLKSGALLEGETFHIARKIFRHFVKAGKLAESDFVVLNGLPRHAGQASDMDAEARVELVAYLDCTAEVVAARIRLNSGGDRGERVDDADEMVARKLKIFAERTMPLVAHYRARGARVLDFTVGVDTAPGDLLGMM